MTDAERELLAVVIGHRIREARVQSGMSQGELASGIGSQSMISLLESGRQLPYPEVLSLIADRLGDESLHQYATQLLSGELSFDTVSSTNENLLFEILRSHRGRWHDIHHRLAIQLCEYFYMRRDIQIVQEICQLLVEHAEKGHTNYIRACFYLGSCSLQDKDLASAELWLRKAEEHADTMDDPLRGRLWYNLGYLYTTMDVQGVAAWHANQAVEQFRRLQDFQSYAKSLGLLGAIQGRMGRTADARATLELAYDIAVKWNAQNHDKTRIQASLIVTYYLLNQMDAALKLIAELQSNEANSPDPIVNTIMLQVSCLCFGKQGEVHKARTTLHQLLSAAYETEDIPIIAYSELLSVVYLESKSEQLQAALRAYDITLHGRAHIEHALAAECAANLYEQLDDPEQAQAYRFAALSGYREYVDRNSMFSHLIQLLPFGALHES